MKTIHFICKDNLHLSRIEKGKDDYTSGNWDLPQADAEKLVGGMIYLHQTKARLSYFGGKVVSAKEIQTKDTHAKRIVFTFTFTPESRGVAWQGTGRATAWTSGVLDAK